MIFPCPVSNPCVDEALSLGNFTSESSDVLLFKSVYYKNMIWMGDIDPFLACFGVCSSPISQEEADFCAARNAAICEASKQFTNVAQSCSLTCADGSVQSYTTPAGLFVADSQAQADAMAAVFCSEYVKAVCNAVSGPGTPGYVAPTLPPGMAAPVIPAPSSTPPPAMPRRVPCDLALATELCTDGGREYIVQAGTIWGNGKEDANLKARNKAFALVGEMGCLGELPLSVCKDNDFGSTTITPDKLTVTVAPYTWVVSGGLPTGLTATPTTSSIKIEGIPTASGTFNFRLEVKDSNGSATWRDYVMHVMEITTAAALPVAERTKVYSTTIVATGGIAPMSYQVGPMGGPLPAGITLNETTGVLSGTPTATGNYAFTIIAQDQAT